MLDLANSALSSARNEISLKRPDFAFVEYIVAQEILSNTVKKNQDFPQVKKITRWEKRYDECLQVSHLLLTHIVPATSLCHIRKYASPRRRLSGYRSRSRKTTEAALLSRECQAQLQILHPLHKPTVARSQREYTITHSERKVLSRLMATMCYRPIL